MINLNHRKPAANTGSEREEPKVTQEKAGAWTIQRPEMGVEAEAKASGRCNRASEESKTRSRRRGHQPVTKTTPTPEKVKDQQTQEKDDEPRRAAETAFAAHKHLRHLRPEARPL